MFKFRRLIIAVGILANAANGQPSATPIANADRAAAAEAARAIMSEKADIGALDALLARLPEPTPLRAALQLRRASEFANANRYADARAAAEEAVRLMPDTADVKINAAYVLSFTGAPQRAADLWLEAAAINPDIAAASDNYFLGGLLGRLRDMNDHARADRLDAKMGEVGVISALAVERSASALTRVKVAFQNGGAEQARPLVSSVISPIDLLALYIDRRFAPLWPTIEQWAGPDFKAAQGRYLTEVRREWWSADRMRSAVNYAQALNAANRYADTVTLFLPVLKATVGNDDTGFGNFLAPAVGTGMYRVGRGAEFDDLLGKIVAGLAPDRAALNLNVSAISVSRAYELEDWSRVAKLADEWVIAARRIGVEVNDSAIRQVAGMGACAHERLSTASKEYDSALMFAGASRNPGVEFSFRLCTNNRAAAKQMLLDALSENEKRTWALKVLQPATLRTNAPPLHRSSFALVEQLRQDKELLVAANRVGRILPKPLLEDLPAGFDPLLSGPSPKPAPDSI